MNEPDPSRPGSVLKAEREALGVSVREVAETLNLSMTVIQAIEADELERLPGPVFARGYVRAYARLLELDPEPLLASCPDEPPPLPLETAPEPPIWEWIRQRPALVLGTGAGVLLTVLLVLVVLLWPSGGDDRMAGEFTDTGADGTVPGAVEPGIEDETAVELGEPLERTTEPSEEVAAVDGARPVAGEAVPAAEALAAIESARARTLTPGGTSAGRTASTADVARRITASGEERLSFVFSDDCWVEVRDTDGGNLYSDLNLAGTSLELVGRGPFRILLGYAPGVELAFNGEDVPLAPHTRNNVATVTLGQ